ncbi:3823_t:CDS:2 [Funneliformis mosseae]|uniref:3823_t:CDS:1 n=1 Tax=Funneliformis mosseae TaxID=27381 RepID=A0A9N9AIA4_FUNMO|nr:3823_t:CDS:2 [Funneliformis mosseae]
MSNYEKQNLLCNNQSLEKEIEEVEYVLQDSTSDNIERSILRENTINKQAVSNNNVELNNVGPNNKNNIELENVKINTYQKDAIFQSTNNKSNFI